MGDDDVRLRLGEPVSDQIIGGDRWLVYSSEKWRLRLRLAPVSVGAPPSVRSLTLDVDDGGSDRGELARGLGLALTGPAEQVPGAAGALLRGEVLANGCASSLTANLRQGAIASVTLFDEPPDWREGGAE